MSIQITPDELDPRVHDVTIDGTYAGSVHYEAGQYHENRPYAAWSITAGHALPQRYTTLQDAAAALAPQANPQEPTPAQPATPPCGTYNYGIRGFFDLVSGPRWKWFPTPAARAAWCLVNGYGLGNILSTEEDGPDKRENIWDLTDGECQQAEELMKDMTPEIARRRVAVAA